jgi:hypothetical protein
VVPGSVTDGPSLPPHAAAKDRDTRVSESSKRRIEIQESVSDSARLSPRRQ